MEEIIRCCQTEGYNSNFKETPIFRLETNNIELLAWLQDGLKYFINEACNNEDWEKVEHYSRSRKECDTAIRELEEVLNESKDN